ncbi:MAG: ABC transporter ATP-binding protein [Armatimonadota bacterium]|nr:ABC transporter ATP-binding protein [Armatimonadota bacterium]MDR7484758.1 ABC transporter ATP-binding protein [Armatimonadota bacterium]MDR7531873.1 ABC transporter ATP-binding protein [Armatimonadota bacterium]MDR7534782.1 ABC transporter ATP-binding protein [Armatimonadota bacterium]
MELVLDRLTCGYGGAPAVHEVSLRLATGQVLCLLGRNGAGKTTLLRAIMGLVRPVQGSIRLDGHELTRLPAHRIPRLGLGYVPQGRRLFPDLTVWENLRMGLLVTGADGETLTWVFELFPVLRERLHQRAGTLSGGEQQMVATARALCARPAFLLMDEPTEGLMPLLVRRLMATIGVLASRGVGVLLVEQKIEAALQVADTVALLETGRIRYTGTRQDVLADEDVLIRHLGVRR